MTGILSTWVGLVASLPHSTARGFVLKSSRPPRISARRPATIRCRVFPSRCRGPSIREPAFRLQCPRPTGERARVNSESASAAARAPLRTTAGASVTAQVPSSQLERLPREKFPATSINPSGGRWGVAGEPRSVLARPSSNHSHNKERARPGRACPPSLRSPPRWDPSNRGWARFGDALHGRDHSVEVKAQIRGQGARPLAPPPVLTSRGPGMRQEICRTSRLTAASASPLEVTSRPTTPESHPFEPSPGSRCRIAFVSPGRPSCRRRDPSRRT